MARLFREIISCCLNLEHPLTIAYLGPSGTYTEAAAIKQFGHFASHPGRCPSIDEVFREVETEACAVRGGAGGKLHRRHGEPHLGLLHRLQALTICARRWSWRFITPYSPIRKRGTWSGCCRDRRDRLPCAIFGSVPGLVGRPLSQSTPHARWPATPKPPSWRREQRSAPAGKLGRDCRGPWRRSATVLRVAGQPTSKTRRITRPVFW